MKRKLVVSIGFLVCIYPLIAQQVVTTGGASNKKPQGSIEYSVGEIATSTYKKSNGSVHEGVIQDYISVATDIVQIENITMQVFPNPVTTKLTIDVESSDDLQYSVYDISGNILESNVFSTHAEIDFQTKAQGTYILKILDKNSDKQNSYSIIKH